MYINVQKDLIDDFLKMKSDKTSFVKKRLSKKFLDRLFRHYQPTELMCTWYDHDLANEERIKSMAGCDVILNDAFGVTLEMMGTMAKQWMEEIKYSSVSLRDRIYCGTEEDKVHIYFYGRDFYQEDFWFTFERRKENPKYVKFRK